MSLLFQSESAKFTAFYAFPLVETIELLVRYAHQRTFL